MSLAKFRKVRSKKGVFTVSEPIYESATPTDIETVMLENLASEDLPKELDPDQAEQDV